MKYSNRYFSSFLHRSNKRKFHPFYDFRIWYITKYLKPKKILDLGCGTGLIVERLRNKNIDAQGMDISPAAIRNSSDKIREFMFIGDITKIPIEHSNYDTVLCVDVLEHIERKNIPKAIKESARIASGTIYFEITTLEDILFIHSDSTHVTKLFSWQWKRILEKELPVNWKVKRGPIFPFLHHGIFIAKKIN